MALTGDAQIAVEFATGQTNGVLDGFFGGTGQGAVASYSGEITLTSNSAAVQNMPITYRGVLTSGRQSLGFDGTLVGAFMGAEVKALVAAELDATVDDNGTVQDATVIVIGEGEVMSPDPAPP